MNWALVMLCLTWGFNWIVMKEAAQFFPPVIFVAGRFIIGAALLLIINYWMKIPLPGRKDRPWIILTGILQIAFNNVAVQIGMQSLGAGFAAVLNYSSPVWVAILAHFFLAETLTGRKVIGIILSMIGLVTLLNVSGEGSLGAILITLVGAFAWAVSSIIIKRKLKDCDMTQYTTWQMVTGAVFLTPYALWLEQGTITWNWLAAGCLLYNGILASALGFMLWSYILAGTEAGKAAISVLAVPVIGVLLGVILLGEPLHSSSAAGMLLILCGIVLVNMKRKPEQERAG